MQDQEFARSSLNVGLCNISALELEDNGNEQGAGEDEHDDRKMDYSDADEPQLQRVDKELPVNKSGHLRFVHQ